MSSIRSALITGITGQDGSFLAELLLEKGYEVTGLVRPSARVEKSLGCADHLRDHVQLVEGDLLVRDTLRSAIERVRPREIYHLAGPSFVPASWEQPGDTVSAIAGSCPAVLEAVRDVDREIRVFVSASAAIFGDTSESPQQEGTPCRPTTPYAIAKLAAHQLVGAMRDHEQLHVSSGILYNHESERRPERFVTRKVTRAAAAISLGLQQDLKLGSLDAIRDWSFAGDVMHGAWLMLQEDHADDYILASGIGRTVAELVELAFRYVGLDSAQYVSVDPALVSPPERTQSIGDPRKARDRLGWKPSISFEQLVERMVRADLLSLETVATAS